MKSTVNQSELKIRQVVQRELFKRGWCYRQLSKMTGVPVSTLNQWVNKSQHRDLHTAVEVSKTLGLSLEELLFGGSG
ncbi:MAG: helix-turn-helix transcriptional regulator [Bdellovibrionota bacterium]